MNFKEPLIEVPLEKWPELRDGFKKTWPAGVPYYYSLHLNIRFPAIRQAFNFKLYCPYGDYTSGLVALSYKDMLSCLIMLISDDTTKLEKALIETKLIDWSKKTLMALMSSKTVELLRRLETKLAFRKFDIFPVTTFFFDRHKSPFHDSSPPEGTYPAQVKLEHITQLDQKWPYKHEASHMYFSTLAANGLSYGLYLSKDDSLVAWVFINEHSFIGHLYCEEAYRRKGCAKYLIEQLVNGQLKKGEDAYGFVVEGNVKSYALFKKIGFEIIEEFAWGIVHV